MHHARHSFAALAATLTGRPETGRHGSRYTEDGEFELTGVVTDAAGKGPRGRVRVEAHGEIWTAEIGEGGGPGREMLAEGAEVTLTGRRSANAEEMAMQAATVEVNGRRYVLDPGLA
ncbi:hypothetical protein [Poseidonocella sp. HB161398]|uniref:hypothetical protein n=1 Tax=Poseidonocella sp. HB161398 TaxID=2320855 RepID=UPI00110992AD|nr:hypothetical protein [Poseidonocella sp. HB161398]